MCVLFYSELRPESLDPFFPHDHTHSEMPFPGRGPSGSPDSLLPAPSQDRAPRLFLSVFWSLVTSFLSWPPGLGRLVLAAASLLVRPFRPPAPGNRARGWGEVDRGLGEAEGCRECRVGVGRLGSGGHIALGQSGSPVPPTWSEGPLMVSGCSHILRVREVPGLNRTALGGRGVGKE